MCWKTGRLFCNNTQKSAWTGDELFFPANFRFNMAELMADSSEISSQNEDNSVVQDEDQRARLTQFPQTRVRNMMKIDPDLHLANRESVFLLTRAAVSEFLYDSKDVSHNSK